MFGGRCGEGEGVVKEAGRKGEGVGLGAERSRVIFYLLRNYVFNITKRTFSKLSLEFSAQHLQK